MDHNGLDSLSLVAYLSSTECHLYTDLIEHVCVRGYDITYL